MILKAILGLFLIIQFSWCIPLNQFYPFGINEGDQLFASNTFNPRFPRSIFLSQRFSFYNDSMFFLSVSLFALTLCINFILLPSLIIVVKLVIIKSLCIFMNLYCVITGKC